jgi:hypothetical protein
MHHDTSGDAGGPIGVGKRVRYIGHPTMTTWSRPCIGMTGRLSRSERVTSKFTGNEIEHFVFEPEAPGKCLTSWMYVRAHEVILVDPDAPSQGEASMFGDCSYDAMLHKADIDRSLLPSVPQ